MFAWVKSLFSIHLQKNQHTNTRTNKQHNRHGTFTKRQERRHAAQAGARARAEQSELPSTASRARTRLRGGSRAAAARPDARTAKTLCPAFQAPARGYPMSSRRQQRLTNHRQRLAVIQCAHSPSSFEDGKLFHKLGCCPCVAFKACSCLPGAPLPGLLEACGQASTPPILFRIA